MIGFQFLEEGGCWGRWANHFRVGGGEAVFTKNTLKSKIFNDNKNIQTKMFFFVISKNFDWEILTKNLVTFER